jgi:hypothetical protein
MELLREAGYFVEKVEQVVHGTFIKRDCFGFFDLLAIKGDRSGVLGVQVTTQANKAAHVEKARMLEAVWTWLRAGNQIVIHSWRKRSERNKDKSWGPKRWETVVVSLTLEDLQPEPDWRIVRAELARIQAEKQAASLAKRNATIARKKLEKSLVPGVPLR